MASRIPRPVIAQAVIVITAVVIFTSALTILGSVPTSNVPERPINAGNATATPSQAAGPAATITPLLGPDDSLTVTVTPVPAPDDSIAATPTPVPADTSITTVTPVPEENDMIAQPDMDVQSLPVNLSGSGSQRTGPFRLEPGTIAFDISSDSPGNIEVWLMYDDEPFDRLLENGLIAEGPLFEQIDTGGNYFLDMTADGEWEINVSQVVS